MIQLQPENEVKVVPMSVRVLVREFSIFECLYVVKTFTKRHIARYDTSIHNIFMNYNTIYYKAQKNSGCMFII